MGYYTFQKGRFGGFDNVLVSATGYTGAGGVEIYAENNAIHALWPLILEAGKEEGLLPAGLGARDTLRLEMGYCLYGNDIDDTTSPLEAGLGWITKLNKGAFVGREAITAIKAAGLKRKLVGLTVDDRRVPRHDYPLLNEADELIGKVTSGTLSPTLEAPIAMAYVAAEHAAAGSIVYVDMGRKKVPATVAKTPFI
jgi:aminomethyltransferase